jgi:2',3'-cyclic-nucleotide 2'-phosphodiesterase (5'-nucleotidase family)
MAAKEVEAAILMVLCVSFLSVSPGWGDKVGSDRKLTILITNDIHSYLLPLRSSSFLNSPWSTIGGTAKLAALIERCREHR